MPSDTALSFRPLTGCHEPSAIQQLGDGRFLVVEDESRHALSLLDIAANGDVHRTALTPGLLHFFSGFRHLEDLEGLALDRAGFVYAVTSHSRDDEGDEKKSREKLVRFRIEGDRVVDPKVVDTLKRSLTTSYPVLAAAAGITRVKEGGGLNIEALEVSADQQRLLIGFRSPLHEGRALIANIENVSETFEAAEAAEAPRMAPALDELDLDGQGIRGLCYLASLGKYLIVSGPVTHERSPFALWLWSGRPGMPPRRVEVAGWQDIGRAEGVSPATIDGVERLVVVCDDGDRKAGRFANYFLLDPARLLEQRPASKAGSTD